MSINEQNDITFDPVNGREDDVLNSDENKVELNNKSDVSGELNEGVAQEKPITGEQSAEAEEELITEANDIHENKDEVSTEDQESEEESNLSPAEIIKKIEAEGDFAADYIEELIDIVDIDGDIDIDVDNGRASVAIVTDEPNADLEDLVGRRGEVLEALQDLTRICVQTKTGERSRLLLDIAGFRAKKKAEIARIANEAIEQCKETGKVVHLEAMNPFERKVVHDLVAAAGLVSDSEGVAPNRHVLIYPAE